MRFTLLHLYPARMNLYGDRGNVLCLKRRLEWRGFDVTVEAVEPGQPVDWTRPDLVFMGGGEDRHQAMIAEDFLGRATELRSALEDGLPLLAICGAFQMLGSSYVTADGRTLPGVRYLDIETRAGEDRCVGNVLVEPIMPGLSDSLVGFENHGGRTVLGSRQEALGRVVRGYGNNGDDGLEGAVRDHVVGTYLHGSLLPKNPALADLLLSWSLARRTGDGRLEPLDDSVERQAHDWVAAAIRRGDPVADPG